MSKVTVKMDRAREMRDNGITKVETYREAVPLIFDLKEAARNSREFAHQLDQLAANLADGAAAYAIDHPKALDEPGLREEKDGIKSGFVEIGNQRYKLTISADDPKRKSGGTFTKSFLAGLPPEWVKTRLELYVSGMKDATEEELAKHDLERPTKRVWSIPEKVR